VNRSRSSSFRYIGISIALTCGLILWVFSGHVPIVQDRQWTCAKTGSRKGKRVYLGLIETAEVRRPSELERLLIAAGHTNLHHEWVKTKGTERYLFFKTHRHSKAPVSSDFDLVLPDFVKRASDEQQQRMMSVFLAGPEDARQAFYREAVQIAVPEKQVERRTAQ
jgi:hypothetical protein